MSFYARCIAMLISRVILRARRSALGLLSSADRADSGAERIVTFALPLRVRLGQVWSCDAQISTQKRRTGVISPKRFIQKLKRDKEQFRSYDEHQARGNTVSVHLLPLCSMLTVCLWTVEICTQVITQSQGPGSLHHRTEVFARRVASGGGPLLEVSLSVRAINLVCSATAGRARVAAGSAQRRV